MKKIDNYIKKEIIKPKEKKNNTVDKALDDLFTQKKGYLEMNPLRSLSDLVHFVVFH